MKLYKELSDAMEEIITETEESEEFKSRLTGLIENHFEASSNESDINSLIELVRFMEESVDGD